MDFKIPLPEFTPKSRFIDLPKSDHQPAKKSLITPPPSYSFDSVDYPAEGTLYGAGCKGNPAFPLKPIFKNQKRILRKVLYISSGLRILLRIKNLNQFFKTIFNLFHKFDHNLFVLRQELFNHLSSQGKKQDFIYKFGKRLLFFFFGSIQVKEDGKVSLSIPDTSLKPHSFRKKIILNPRPTIREKNFQLLIIQSLIGRFVDKSPVFIHPESYEFKPSFHAFRSQSPPHVCLIYRFSLRPLTFDPHPIDHQKLEGTVLQARPFTFVFGQLFYASVQSALARSVSFNSAHLFFSQSVGKMDHLIYCCFKSFSLILLIGKNRELLDQRRKHPPCLPVIKLSQSIVDRTERGDKLSCPGLPAMLVKSIRMAGYMLIYRFLFQCRKNRLNHITHQFVLIFLKATQYTAERKAFFCYLIRKDDLDFKFVHSAPTSLFLIRFFKGYSPSFVFMSTFPGLFDEKWGKFY